MTLSSQQTKIMFLTNYVCRSRVDFLGPVGERYAGLYFSFMERFRSKYDFYWHSGTDGKTYEYQAESNTLQPLSSDIENHGRLSLIKVILFFCLSNLKAQKIFIVSYPYFPNSLLLASLLFLVKPFRVSTVVDVIDLPRETPGTAGYVLWRIVDELYYLHALFIFNATECAKLFARRIRRRIIVIPMAAHDDLITPTPSAATGNGVRVGYVGTISRARGFPDFIEIVNHLRGEGLVIDLVINGSNPENIHLGSFPWVRLHELQSFESFSELLGTFDVGVIPYVDKEYWDYMSITKMATYMAAGLPILSMQLTETSNILAKWNCGVSVKDWADMAVALKQLCEDRSLIERLGRNSRRAAVEEYNWAKQAERLGRFLEDLVANFGLGNQRLDREPTRSGAHYYMARKATKLASRQSVD